MIMYRLSLKLNVALLMITNYLAIDTWLGSKRAIYTTYTAGEKDALIEMGSYHRS